MFYPFSSSCSHTDILAPSGASEMSFKRFKATLSGYFLSNKLINPKCNMQQKAGEKAENKTVDTHEQNYLTENKLKTELSMNQEYTRTSAANAGKTQQDYRAGEQAVDTAPK